MNGKLPNPSGWVVAGLYWFFAFLILWPAADMVTNVWPLNFGNLQWRYGFMGLLSGFLHTPILGLSLAMGLSWVTGRWRTLTWLSILSVVGSVALLAVFIFFPLDVLQVRAGVPDVQLPSFHAGALIAELKHLTSCIALLLIGVGGFKTARRTVRHPSEASDRSRLVMAKAEAE